VSIDTGACPSTVFWYVCQAFQNGTDMHYDGWALAEGLQQLKTMVVKQRNPFKADGTIEI